jgi:hypothetical protein
MIEEIHFDSLILPIPDIIKEYPIEIQREIFEYLNELDNLEKIGYKIAFNHLGSSFDICRSNGYLKWKQTKVSN